MCIYIYTHVWDILLSQIHIYIYPHYLICIYTPIYTCIQHIYKYTYIHTQHYITLHYITLPYIHTYVQNILYTHTIQSTRCIHIQYIYIYMIIYASPSKPTFCHFVARYLYSKHDALWKCVSVEHMYIISGSSVHHSVWSTFSIAVEQYNGWCTLLHSWKPKVDKGTRCLRVTICLKICPKVRSSILAETYNMWKDAICLLMKFSLPLNL